ncbi:MAG: hypothetical protein A4E35_00640 [Methanoregula sp. PtaU1.Bin051]|nr:MAG: hypothetical protein A4E35_00640 [Methanoregula sp. PtaU1.Bin051]
MLWRVTGRISGAIRKISTGKTLLVSLALYLVTLILIWGKPFGIAQLQEITGGPTILDMTFTTSPQQVYATLDALGEAGRAFDLARIVPLDLVFPFAYTLFLVVVITWILSRYLPQESPWYFVNIIPLLAGAADYCENAGIIILLLSYPAISDPVAVWVSAMYIVKFVFSALSFIALFGALAGWGFAAVRNRLGKGGRSLH